VTLVGIHMQFLFLMWCFTSHTNGNVNMLAMGPLDIMVCVHIKIYATPLLAWHPWIHVHDVAEI